MSTPVSVVGTSALGLARRPETWWLLPLLAVAAAVNLFGIARSPQRVDDEGTYVAQAFAVQQWGELGHYTYWYDHPPLGWLQLATWTWTTHAFERWHPAVIAGREFMVVVHLVSVVLLWFLVRRLLDSPVAATIAAALFSLSPLAVMFHRAVYLDNIATTWLLAACLLATSRRHQLLSHLGAGLCAGVAVLTKETYLLLVVPVAWEILRRAHPSTRRYTVPLAVGSLAIVGTGYLAFAVLKGELLPGDGVSLTDAIAFQLFNREGSGSVFDEGSPANDTLELWLGADPILPVAGIAASVVGLAVSSLRPYAATYLMLAALLLRDGYLPVPYVIGALPLAAIVVAGVVVLAARRINQYDGDLAYCGSAIALTVASILVVPVWANGLERVVADDADAPLRQAQEWMVANVPLEDRMLVDDAVWVDLVRAGFPRDRVVWHYKPDTDPEVAEKAPGGWRSYRWLLVTETVRQSAADYPTVQAAFDNSRTVVAFGEGKDRVLVRRISIPEEASPDADPQPDHRLGGTRDRRAGSNDAG